MKIILGTLIVFFLLLGVMDLYSYFSGLESNIDTPGVFLICAIGSFIAYFVQAIIQSRADYEERRASFSKAKAPPGWPYRRSGTRNSSARRLRQEQARTTRRDRPRSRQPKRTPTAERARYQPPVNRLARRLERAGARKRGTIAEWKRQERLERRARLATLDEKSESDPTR